MSVANYTVYSIQYVLEVFWYAVDFELCICQVFCVFKAGIYLMAWSACTDRDMMCFPTIILIFMSCFSCMPMVIAMVTEQATILYSLGKFYGASHTAWGN